MCGFLQAEGWMPVASLQSLGSTSCLWHSWWQQRMVCQCYNLSPSGWECGLSTKRQASTVTKCTTWQSPDLLSPHPPSSSLLLFEVFWVHCWLHRIANKSHTKLHLLVSHCHAKTLATAPPHDCQDSFTHLLCHTTTVFCISISFLGVQQQALYFGRNLRWLDLGLGQGIWLSQVCSVKILLCLFFWERCGVRISGTNLFFPVYFCRFGEINLHWTRQVVVTSGLFKQCHLPPSTPQHWTPTYSLTKSYHLITIPYHLSLKTSYPTTPASRAKNCTHRPSKTMLSQWVSTPIAVEMGGVVHAQTSNTWKTDKHALEWHGGGGQTPPDHVKEGGEETSAGTICWFLLTLLRSQSFDGNHEVVCITRVWKPKLNPLIVLRSSLGVHLSQAEHSMNRI